MDRQPMALQGGNQGRYLLGEDGGKRQNHNSHRQAEGAKHRRSVQQEQHQDSKHGHHGQKGHEFVHIAGGNKTAPVPAAEEKQQVANKTG
ncbi:hypothetical protein D3C76_1704320 [compost metagenome]